MIRRNHFATLVDAHFIVVAGVEKADDLGDSLASDGTADLPGDHAATAESKEDHGDDLAPVLVWIEPLGELCDGDALAESDCAACAAIAEAIT